jgi:hypothetical protein
MRRHIGFSSLILAVAISGSSVSAQQAGKEPGPAVTFAPTSLSFDNQPVGIRSAVQTVTLTNSGNLPLTIVRIYLSSTDYSQTHDCPASLPAGASCNLSVTFLPTGSGTRASVVRIDDDAPGSPHRLSLSGAGITSGPQQTEGGAAVQTETRPDRNVDAPTPDTRPLSGAEEITAGSQHIARNYVLPSLHVTAYGDSNQLTISTGTRGLGVTGSVIGRLALQRVWKTSQFIMDYKGGGLLYSRNQDFNAMVHDFGFTESLRGRRWGLMITNRASYLPESPFGFTGLGGIGGLGTGLGGSFGTNLGNLSPAFSPNQSILSGRGTRVANTTVAQLEYNLSARSMVTASGSYGLLRFKEPGLIESNQRVYTAGYNYMATRKDTVAIVYGLSQLQFKGVSLGFDTHFFQLSYGRRVTGRLAWELAAGPQVSIFKSSTTPSDQQVSWNAHSSLRYRLPRTDLGLSYGHFTSTGSGLLFGAETDQVGGSVGWRFTRNWSGSIDPGYARNRRLRQTTAGGNSITYDSVHAGFRLRRAVGRYMDVSFNYSLQDQRRSSTANTGVGGGNVYIRHLFGFGFNWHTRPIDID